MLKSWLKSKKLFYLLLGLMVFILLYPKFPLLNIPGTYVAIRLEDLFIALVSIIWLVINLPRVTRYLKQPIFQAILLFWLIGLVSLLSALLVTYSVKPHLGLLHFLRRVEYMSLFVMAATTITSWQQVKLVLKTFLVVALVVILYGFGQQWLNFPVISTTNREFSKGLILFLTPDARVNSTFAGHYDLAVFLTIVLIMLGSLLFYSRQLLDRFWLALTGLLSFALLGMTAARVSFVATVAGLALTFWLTGKRLLVAALLLAAIAALALIPELRHRLVATVTVNLLGGGGPKYTVSEKTVLKPNERLSEAARAALLKEATKSASNIATVASDIAPGEPINPTELGVYRSFGIRLEVEWPRALRAFYKNPLLGTGYSSITIATDNDLLRMLGEVGLLGTIAFALIFIILIGAMTDFIQNSVGFERSLIIGVLCSLIAVFLTGLFIDVLEASKVATLLWFLLGMSWAVIKDYHVN